MCHQFWFINKRGKLNRIVAHKTEYAHFLDVKYCLADAVICPWAFVKGRIYVGQFLTVFIFLTDHCHECYCIQFVV